MFGMRVSTLAVVFLSTEVLGFSPANTFLKHQHHGLNGDLSSMQQGRGTVRVPLRASSENDEPSNDKNGVSAPPAPPEPLPQTQEEPKQKNFFNDRFINDDIEALVEEKAQEQIAQKEKEISQLMRQKEQRETTINRLKFQLLDFKEAVEKSEQAKIEAEKELDEIEKEKMTAKSKEKDLLEQLKSQFRLEKKEMAGSLKTVSKELDKVKLAAKKELDIARSDAEQEKVQLLLEISSLQQALQETSSQIIQTKSELDAMATSNVAEFGRQQEDMSKKDGRISELLEQKEELKAELESRLVELDQLKMALNESEALVAMLEKEVEAVRKESEESRKADQDLLSELKSQFNKEKESLTQTLQTFTEDVTKFKADKEDQLKQVKSDSESQIKRLRSKLSYAEKELEKTQVEYNALKGIAENAQQEADKKVRRQKKESKRFEKNVKSATAQEKKALRWEIWDLETKLEAARYNYITLKKDLKEMEAAASAFDEKMKDLESSYIQQLEDLENKMKNEEIAFKKSQESTKQRMVRLVLAFQRRLSRREEKSQKEMERVRDGLTKDFEQQKKEILQEKEDTVNDVKSKAKADLDEVTKNFEDKIEDLKSQMESANKKYKKKMAETEENYETTLKYERAKAAKAKEDLIAEKNTAIKAIETDAATKYNMLKTDLTSQLDQALIEKMALQDTLTQRELKVATYEAERQSFRKLVRQTWVVSRSKVLRRKSKEQ